MLTHAQIWSALDRLAARAGLSPSGLAKKAGPRPDHLQQVEAHHPGRPPALAVDRIGRQGADRHRHQLDTFVQLIDESGRPPAKAVPLIGFAQAGAGGYFDDGGFPVGKGWDEIAFPAVNDEHAYALEISGKSMEPAYRDGDIIMVSPAASIRRGDRVVVKTRDGEVMVKELKRRTAKTDRAALAQSAHSERTLPVREWSGSRACVGEPVSAALSRIREGAAIDEFVDRRRGAPDKMWGGRMCSPTTRRPRSADISSRPRSLPKRSYSPPEPATIPSL